MGLTGTIRCDLQSGRLPISRRIAKTQPIPRQFLTVNMTGLHRSRVSAGSDRIPRTTARFQANLRAPMVWGKLKGARHPVGCRSVSASAIWRRSRVRAAGYNFRELVARELISRPRRGGLPSRLDLHAEHVVGDLRADSAEAGADLLSAIEGRLHIRQDVPPSQFIHKVSFG